MHLLKNKITKIFTLIMITLVSVLNTYQLSFASDLDYYDQILEDKTGVATNLIATVVFYGRIVLLLLIFIAIVFAGIRHMLGGTDPKQKAKTAITLKNILAGIIIFIIMISLIGIVIEYLDKSYEVIETSKAEIEETFYHNDDRIAGQSLLLDLIEMLINAYNAIVSGIIELLMKNIDMTTEGCDYIGAIYDVYAPDGSVSTNKPFDETGVEWSRLMTGYNCFVSIAFLMLVFVFVKTAIEYVLYAGNEKKLVEVKESWFRIFWAVLLLLTVPYIVKLLIYLFNYMTAVVPVDIDNNKFEIDIDFPGVLGAIADCYWITTKWNIFLTFYVRHLMIDILVVSAPVVIAAWAISKKFKSFPLWFGELLTNIATQFCYAVGFTIVLLLSFEDENPIYGMILATVSIQLAKFVKDSLQGFFLAGAGIDEEGTATSIVGRVFGWGNKVKNKGKSLLDFAGGLATKVDPKHQKGFTRGVYNLSQIGRGRFNQVVFSPGKSDKQLRQDKDKIQAQIDHMSDEDEQVEAQEYLDAIDAGKEIDEKTGGIFDAINRYKVAKKAKKTKISQMRDNIVEGINNRNIQQAAETYGGAPIEDARSLSELQADLRAQTYAEEEAEAASNLINTLEGDNDEMINEAQSRETLDNTLVLAEKEMKDFAENYMSQDMAVRNATIKNLGQALHNLQVLDASFFDGSNKETLEALQMKIAETMVKQLASTNGSESGGIKVKINIKGLSDLMDIESDETYDKVKPLKPL